MRALHRIGSSAIVSSWIFLSNSQLSAQDALPVVQRLPDTLRIINRQSGPTAAYTFAKSQVDLLVLGLQTRIDTVTGQRLRAGETRSAATNFLAGLAVAQVTNPVGYPQFDSLTATFRSLLKPSTLRTFENRRTTLTEFLQDPVGSAVGGALNFFRSRIFPILTRFNDNLSEAIDYAPDSRKREFWTQHLRRSSHSFSGDAWDAYGATLQAPLSKFLTTMQRENESTLAFADSLEAVATSADNLARDLDAQLSRMAALVNYSPAPQESVDKVADDINDRIRKRFEESLGTDPTEFTGFSHEQLQLLVRAQALALATPSYSAGETEVHCRLMNMYQSSLNRLRTHPADLDSTAVPVWNSRAAQASRKVQDAACSYVDTYRQRRGSISSIQWLSCR
jgi:hypothetical protein